MDRPERHIVAHAVVASGFALLVGLVLVFAADIFLLAFAGVLFAVFLRTPADFLAHRLAIKSGWALLVVGLAILGGTALFGVLVAPSVAEQFDHLSRALPEAVERLKEQILKYNWGRQLMAEAASTDIPLTGRSGALTKATGVVSSTLNAFANLFIIFFSGIYLAAEPKLYLKGLTLLFPAKHRSRSENVIGEIGETLRWWLLGKIVGMLIIGTLTTVGLWFLDVSMALSLGLIAAALTFIPNIGPLLAFIPAFLIGITESHEKALHVFLLYFSIQLVESYLVTPVLQRRIVSLPPALTLTAQGILGVLFGILGVALAAPLTAVGTVLIKKLYVEANNGRANART